MLAGSFPSYLAPDPGSSGANSAPRWLWPFSQAAGGRASRRRRPSSSQGPGFTFEAPAGWKVARSTRGAAASRDVGARPGATLPARPALRRRPLRRGGPRARRGPQDDDRDRSSGGTLTGTSTVTCGRRALGTATRSSTATVDQLTRSCCGKDRVPAALPALPDGDRRAVCDELLSSFVGRASGLALGAWRCVGRGAALAVERRGEHVLDRVGGDELSASRVSGGSSSRSVSFSRGRITRFRPGALRGERLLAQPADREHLAGERDLAGHADVVGDRRRRGRATRSRSPSSRPPTGRPSARRPRARGCARRASRTSRPAARASSACDAHPRERRLRRLLHHLAELAGDRQPALARVRGRLDEEHVAADRRVRRGRSRRPGPTSACAPRPRSAAARASRAAARRRRWIFFSRALRDLGRGLAADVGEPPLEPAHAGLARVLADDGAQHACRSASAARARGRAP